jgi:hypothetical protein
MARHIVAPTHAETAGGAPPPQTRRIITGTAGTAERWRASIAPDAHHACGPKDRRASSGRGRDALDVSSAAQWRAWGHMICVLGRALSGPAWRTRSSPLAALWLALTLTPGWWARSCCAGRIAQLEGPSDAAAAAWARTRVMLLGESTVFWCCWPHGGTSRLLLARVRRRALQAFAAVRTSCARRSPASAQAEAIAEGISALSSRADAR